MALISQYSTTQGPCEMLSRRVMSWSKEMKLNPVFNLQMFGRLNKSVSLECHFCTSSIRTPVIHQRDVKHLKVSASKCNSQNVTEKPDPIYRNRLVNMLVNRILKHGKKSLAYQIIYRALKRIQQKTETNPLLVLRQAIREVTPEITVKARRVGGSTHQIPVEIRSTQGKTLAIRWLLGASRKRLGRNMVFKLSSELVDAANGSGAAIRKKEETHKMAEANRAFAHFR